MRAWAAPVRGTRPSSCSTRGLRRGCGDGDGDGDIPILELNGVGCNADSEGEKSHATKRLHDVDIFAAVWVVEGGRT
jgi:hypothetical protein